MSASVRNSRRQKRDIVQLPGAVTELDSGLADVQVADLLQRIGGQSLNFDLLRRGAP
jgi:hypothetical protein